MSTVHWEDPPSPPRRGAPPGMTADQQRSWMQVGDALRAHPGRWAWVATAPTSDSARVSAGQIRRGRRPAMGPGPWEATHRTVQGVHRVYARYTGGGAA
jgi:hypothetical protein